MLNDFTESLLCPQIFVILKQLLSRNVLDLLNTVCVNENYPENLCGQRLLRHLFFLSSLSFLNLLNIPRRPTKRSVKPLHIFDELIFRLCLILIKISQNELLLLNHLKMLVSSGRSWLLSKCRLRLISHLKE